MVSFYAFPVIFIDTVTFKKGHPNQKGGCPDTLDTPLDPPLYWKRHSAEIQLNQSGSTVLPSSKEW